MVFKLRSGDDGEQMSLLASEGTQHGSGFAYGDPLSAEARGSIVERDLQRAVSFVPTLHLAILGFDLPPRAGFDECRCLYQPAAASRNRSCCSFNGSKTPPHHD